MIVIMSVAGANTFAAPSFARVSGTGAGNEATVVVRVGLASLRPAFHTIVDCAAAADINAFAASGRCHTRHHRSREGTLWRRCGGASSIDTEPAGSIRSEINASA